MAIKLSDYLVKMTTEDDNYHTPVIYHWCNGCGELHGIACLGVPFMNGAKWTWDEDVLAPSVFPSMNIGVGPFPDGHMERCHYFVERGQIRYLDDCTHDLKGKTVPLPPIPASSLFGLGIVEVQPPEESAT